MFQVLTLRKQLRINYRRIERNIHSKLLKKMIIIFYKSKNKEELTEKHKLKDSSLNKIKIIKQNNKILKNEKLFDIHIN
jgi:hypothetical protein